MMERMIRIRELAGWTFDEDEFRPGDYDRSKHSHAKQRIAQRAPCQLGNVLLKEETAAIQDILASHASRLDLQAEMMGLNWSLGVIDLRLLIAFQRRIGVGFSRPPSPMPGACDWSGLTAVSFPAPRLSNYDVARELDTNTLIFRSSDPNLRFRLSDDPSSPLHVYGGSPFFEVAQYRERWFLRDGYHRAYQLLRANIFKMPAVIVYARAIEELGATRPWFFSEEALFSATPPRVIDFLDDALVLEYNRPLLIKTLRVTVEESLEPEALPGDRA
jgi:hypothetical protein